MARFADLADLLPTKSAENSPLISTLADLPTLPTCFRLSGRSERGRFSPHPPPPPPSEFSDHKWKGGT